jgi:hypothetical protein
MTKWLLVMLVSFSLGCSSSDEVENLTQTAPTNGTDGEMQDAARLLVSGFQASLKAELMNAVKEGGVVNAIGVCQVKAPQVADSFSREAWSIKRVTEKPRNRLNKADAHEQEILGLFADTLKKLEFFDEWADSEAKTGYTYYQPINIGAFCLNCHGPSTTIDEGVASALQEKYPEDEAVDYRAGDLRGMFVVHIDSRENIPLLQQALQGSL